MVGVGRGALCSIDRHSKLVHVRKAATKEQFVSAEARCLCAQRDTLLQRTDDASESEHARPILMSECAFCEKHMTLIGNFFTVMTSTVPHWNVCATALEAQWPTNNTVADSLASLPRVKSAGSRDASLGAASRCPQSLFSRYEV